MITQRSRWLLALCLLALLLLAQCQTPDATPTLAPAEFSSSLSGDQIATLESLQLLDDYPLYSMHYYGDYTESEAVLNMPDKPGVPAWACSLFAALGDPDNLLYGRNFDWDYSPGLLLFTHPADGLDSVSMVDIAYLGFAGADAHGIAELALEERAGLLDAPWWPFDGMNEMGLVVGMAAVPENEMPNNPGKPIIDSITVIREILDHAGTVDEAVEILQSYNIIWDGGPALHYLVADASGRAVLVEFYRGEHRIIYNQQPWHQATNFLLSAAGDSPESQCYRYQTISQKLTANSGELDTKEAIELLKAVAQPGTQWSAVYSLSNNTVNVVMGQQYADIHTLKLTQGQ